MQRIFLLLSSLLLSAVSAGSVPLTLPCDTGGNTYQNPVYDHDFPDPNLVKAADGYFYAYSTNIDWREEGLGGPYTIPVLRSKDLVHWTFVRDAFEKKPTWKKGGIWAPDVTYYQHRYLLFYSFSLWGDPDPAIGLAVSNKPEGPFTDLGQLFYSREIGVPNSIDPYLMVDHGKPYLIWGSFHGIFGIPLSADATRVAGKKFQIADRAFEGSYIYKRGRYYYYFGSVGTCCDGASSTYRVLVGRATSLRGPYLDRAGRSLLEGGGTLLLQASKGEKGFAGPGHNGDIVQDDKGQDWVLYHAIDRAQPRHQNGKGTRRPLLLDKIEWVNGWPVIGQGQPSLTPQEAPFF